MNIKTDTLQIETRAFIDGEYVESIDQNTIKKTSSIDGRKLPSLTSCNKKDVDRAVEISLDAYKSKIWSGKSLISRQKIILKLAQLVEDNKEELALLDTLETGRSLKNFLIDSIPKAVESMRWFAHAIDKVFDKSVSPSEDVLSIIVREPLGVVGIITPWNDPLVVSFWKLVPALLMGNSVILKPAESSSYSILKVAKLAIEAGIPKGIFNVIPGLGCEAGKELALHNHVRGIFFTGSTDIGKKIMQYAGFSNLKRVGLECGGKSPYIVSKKCSNLQRAAKVLAKNIFYNQGQICSAPSKLLVHSSIKLDFVKFLIKESEAYIPSDPLSNESEVGALISNEHKKKIEGIINQGVKNGAKIMNSAQHVDPIAGGAYLPPMIFDNVDPNSIMAQEEIFGPILVVFEFNNIMEAIIEANKSKYGLAASIWTDDYSEAHQVSKKLEAGIVHINSYGDDDNTVPFGGIKESGIGSDKSIYAFDEYSNRKTIWMNFER
jgi:acyl-CoA reductase-like NAD-dependent aldehyde dehydrogenase